MPDTFQITNDDLIITSALTLTSAHVREGHSLQLSALSSLLQDTRNQHLHNHDMHETHLADSIGYLLSNLSINILKPAYCFDELSIQIYSPGFRKQARGFKLKYLITRDSDRAMIAQGLSTQLFYNFEQQRTTRSPEAFHAVMHRNLRLLQLPLGASIAA